MTNIKNPLDLVLLVDDDAPTNFLHKLIIQKANFAKEVKSVQSGREALEYLSSTNEDGNHPQPDLIFLDINMPGMTGWEFLVEYNKIPDNQKASIIVVMLTSSINPDDKNLAQTNALIAAFESKPLTIDRLNELLFEINKNKLK